MDENKNFETEEIVEVEPIEVETEETENNEGSNSLTGLAIGALVIGGVATATALFIKKHREKWAKKYLEKRGYEVKLNCDAEDEDYDENYEVDEDTSDEE